MNRDRCNLCGSDFPPGKQWVILNRYALGTGRSRCCIEGQTRGGDYYWEMNDNGVDVVSGPILCYPECVLQWIEGKIVGVDWEARQP